MHPIMYLCQRKRQTKVQGMPGRKGDSGEDRLNIDRALLQTRLEIDVSPLRKDLEGSFLALLDRTFLVRLTPLLSSTISTRMHPSTQNTGLRVGETKDRAPPRIQETQPKAQTKCQQGE